MRKKCQRIHKENIRLRRPRIVAGLYTITSALRIGKQDRTEQRSLPAHLTFQQRPSRKQLEENTMYLVENESMDILL